MSYKRLNHNLVAGYTNRDFSLKDQWITALLLSFFFGSFVHSSNTTTAQSLDVTLHKHAFDALIHQRPHTGAIYEPALPANLAGIRVSVVRLRSKTLWRRGANFSYFHIPSRTLPMPHVRRIFLVYQDLGNWSSHYYNITGYSLVSSVVGFMVYDASNLTFDPKKVTSLELNTTGASISIQFPNLTLPRTKCATFGAKGGVSLSDTGEDNVCYGRSSGHFSIVVPSGRKQRPRVWSLWVIGFGVGFALLASAGFIGMVIVKFLKVKKIDEMERQANEGVVLGTMLIGNSQMPCATVTRTHPVLENPGLP